jgi:hypothetical protein
MSVNPQDLAAARFKPIRQALERIAKAEAACAKSTARREELRSSIGAAEHRDRRALGRALVDGKSEPLSEAAKLRRNWSRRNAGRKRSPQKKRPTNRQLHPNTRGAPRRLRAPGRASGHPRRPDPATKTRADDGRRLEADRGVGSRSARSEAAPHPANDDGARVRLALATSLGRSPAPRPIRLPPAEGGQQSPITSCRGRRAEPTRWQTSSALVEAVTPRRETGRSQHRGRNRDRVSRSRS